MYEGFGIPPLEAMSLSCPVICSNTSSIPEVVGEAAELFDPNSVESIVAAIEKVLYSADYSEHLKSLGHKRIKLFSWEKCAKQTQEVYLSLL
jgi:glycosyltransferase involved in cell wall biosynthesis